MKRTLFFLLLTLSLIALLPAEGELLVRGTATQEKPARTAPPSQAKAKKMWVRVNYQVGFDEPSADYSGTFSLYHEDAVLATRGKVKKGNFPVIAFGYQVHPLIGLELSAAFGKRDLDATTTAHVPHPLRFDAMRTATRHDTDSINQLEICLGAVYSKRFGKLGVDITAGPAIVQGKTDLVTGFSVVDTYPFTNPEVTFERSSQSKTAFGFFAGASVDYYIGQSLAIDVGVRYISASVAFEPVSGQDMKLKLGGLQAGGGIKFLF